MGRKKVRSAADDNLEMFDDGALGESIDGAVDDGVLESTDLESTDMDLELPDDVMEVSRPPVNGIASRARARLEVKRRLDAYLERKWFRDHGWDDDDELFNDEFFMEDDPDPHQHI
jgi:hypothetical protein